MKIAILGCGTVGKGVVKILEDKFPEFEIVKIVVRKEEDCLDGRFTTSFYEIFKTDVDVLLEMIVGDYPTYDYIKSALVRGIHVITSNKVTVSNHLEEYLKLAKENGCQFKYEASVAGGIPWIQGIMKARRIDKITMLEGILNGTTNYILDHMLKESKEYAEILSRAQQLGYAESNPSADVDGLDALRKICISSSLAYNVRLKVDELDCMGITNVQYRDLKKFYQEGYVVKLMGFSMNHENQVYTCVEPVLVNLNSRYATVDENNNAVSLHGDTIGELMFIGQGAGQMPTANAMIQDLIDIEEKRIDHEILFEDCEYNRGLMLSHYIFCSNKDCSEIFKDKIEKVDHLHGRYYTSTLLSTVEEKNEWVKQLKGFDSSFFYVRRR